MVILAAGVMFMGMGLPAFWRAARQDSHVVHFVCGLVMLFGGAGHLMLRSYGRSIQEMSRQYREQIELLERRTSAPQPPPADNARPSRPA